MTELLQRPKYVYLPYRFISAALVPADREWLHERIEERFELMLELGLIGELRRLRKEYALEPDMPSMRCVGYRQVWRYLDGEYGLATLREKGVSATRQLAKRQLTWLKSMPDPVPFDPSDDNLGTNVMAHVRTKL
jgi:tRNA dimethylallyltransferase